MRRLLLAALILAGLAGGAQAQSNSPTLLLNGCGTGNLAGNNIAYATVDAQGRWCVSFSPGAGQMITGNAAGTTGAVVGTLAADTTGKTTYICGFNVYAIGGTATVGPITVAGLVGSSQVYQGSSSAAGGKIAGDIFNPCLPASAKNTAITISTTADGSASAVNVNSWGFQF